MVKIKKGSLTVELSLVFPLFFFAVIGLIYILIWFQKAESTQSSLVSSVRHGAALSIQTDKLIGKFGSNIPDDLILSKKCSVSPDIPFFSYVKINTKNRVVMRKYTGVKSMEEYDSDEIVYITHSGEVYHCDSSCTYLKAQVKEVSIGELQKITNYNNEHYKPCSMCITKGLSDNAGVYITRYGIRYHSDVSCKAILKNKMAVRYKAVENKRACSKCGRVIGKGEQ